MIRVSVNNESLNRVGRAIAQKVNLARLKDAAKIEALMKSAAEDAKESSMVATGQTQDNTQYFGKSDGANETRLAMGIKRGDNEQELFTEGLSSHTGGSRIHTSIDEHVKAKCSRSILGNDAGKASFYRANPSAKKRSLSMAIQRNLGIDVIVRGLHRGGVNRYEPAAGVKNSRLWRIAVSGFKEVFTG